MSVAVYISHARSQAAEAMGLVDLLESALSLGEGAIACSSLPGYAAGRDPRQALESAQAVIAWVDDASVQDPRIAFDLGLASGLGKWIVLMTDAPRVPTFFPWSLPQATVVVRSDQRALRAMVEDVAFQLDVQPRLGPVAAEAMARVSEPPPPPPSSAPPVALVGKSAAPVQTPAPLPAPVFTAQYEIIDTVPPPSGAPPAQTPSPRALRGDPTGEFDLEDEDLVALADDMDEHGVGCRMALEAGRAISDCAFHRGDGAELARELAPSFGRFVDAIGGNWSALAEIGDVDVWVGAAENLLGALSPERKHVAAWYGLGFEFTTLLDLATAGVPEDAVARNDFKREWQSSITQFRSFAEKSIREEAALRIQTQLENLLAPEAVRDYTNVARSLDALRAQASSADASR